MQKHIILSMNSFDTAILMQCLSLRFKMYLGPSKLSFHQTHIYALIFFIYRMKTAKQCHTYFLPGIYIFSCTTIISVYFYAKMYSINWIRGILGNNEPYYSFKWFIKRILAECIRTFQEMFLTLHPRILHIA